MKEMILASGSPRRKELFELADLTFQVIPSTVEEVITKTAPEEVVLELAGQKAEDVFEKTGRSEMVIGADTVVAYEGKILGKPADDQEAKEMLSMLSGNTIRCLPECLL